MFAEMVQNRAAVPEQRGWSPALGEEHDRVPDAVCLSFRPPFFMRKHSLQDSLTPCIPLC